MRICIITFSNSDENYGQLLQCWSLQKTLECFGHEVYVINYSKIYKKFSVKILLKSLLIYPIIKKIKRCYQENKNSAFVSKLNEGNQKRNFDVFRKTKLHYYPIEYHSIEELQNNPPDADCYVAGSDSIWAQILNDKNNRAYFLDFGSENIKRVSYSASFLMNEYPLKWKPELKRLLSRFDAISVREPEGKRICSDIGCSSDIVCDPTLLLSRNEIVSTFNINEIPTKTVYVYSVNIQNKDEIRWDELKDAAEKYCYNIKVTVSSGMYPGYEIYGESVDYDYCSIEKWIDNINNSSYVVSSSFHGVVFSIIMETPFVYVPFKGGKERLNARIYYLLDILGLSDRIMNEDSNFSQIMSKQIDWKSVKDCLCKYRQFSLDYLKRVTSK